MKINNFPPLRLRILIALGLLLMAIPFLINNYFKMADFFRGLIFGLGLGVEIMGVILVMRFKISDDSSSKTNYV